MWKICWAMEPSFNSNSTSAVSSANLKRQVTAVCKFIWLVYIENNIGERTHPWGAPEFSRTSSDRYPFTQTRCGRSRRKSLIHSISYTSLISPPPFSSLSLGYLNNPTHTRLIFAFIFVVSVYCYSSLSQVQLCISSAVLVLFAYPQPWYLNLLSYEYGQSREGLL